MKEYYIYWYKLREHTDPYLQGYIGFTNNLERRNKEHHRRCENPTNENSHPIFFRAVHKYGWANIEQVVLYRTENKSDALAKENEYRPEKNIGWNCTVGGGYCPDWTGKHHTEEAKQKLAKSATGRISPLKGITNRWTEEQRKAISVFHKGKAISQKQIETVRAKNRANHPSCSPIHLVHKGEPEKIYKFHSISEASRQLGIPLPRLKSKVQRALNKYGRDGWKVVFYKGNKTKQA